MPLVGCWKEVAIMNKKEIDILHGNMEKNIFLLALPIGIASCLQILFNAVDAIMVGRFVGVNALAAVSGNAGLTGIFTNVIMGLAVGVNVVVAKKVVTAKKSEIKHLIQSLLMIGFCLGLGLAVFAEVLAPLLHHLLQTPEGIQREAVIYFRIYALSFPFLAIYNFAAAIFRSAGESKKPMLCVAMSGVINVGLNTLFLLVFHLGVSGVAIATGIANVINAIVILCMLYISKTEVQLELGEWKWEKDGIRAVFQAGIPSALQMALFPLSQSFIQQGINQFGEEAMSAFSIAHSVDGISYNFIVAFSQAVVTFLSQNHAAHNIERCRKAFRIGVLEAFGLSLVLCLTFYLFRYPLIHMYTSNKLVEKYALIRFRYIGILEEIVTFTEVPSGGLKGLGSSIKPAVISIIGYVGLRIIWALLVFPRWSTFLQLNLVFPFSWVVTGGIMLIVYCKHEKKTFLKEEF